MTGAEDSIRSAIERGDLLVAFDHARARVLEGEASVTERWLGLLALARSGATPRAIELFVAWGLEDLISDPRAERRDDLMALAARLAKDEALAATGPTRAAAFSHAATLYEGMWVASRRPYEGVNAATMLVLTGEAEQAQTLAADVAARNAGLTPSTPEQSYWQEAIAAECALVRGDAAGCAAALERGGAVGFENLAARSSTRRQLRILCDAVGIDPSVLDALPMPRVAHYTGHLLGAGDGRFPAGREGDIRTRVDAVLDEERVGFGYGSLAAGADIVVAEALLGRGAELHVQLPCTVDAFRTGSVAPAGPEWVERFERCLAGASSLSCTTQESDPFDPTSIDFNARVAMGRAVGRSVDLETSCLQVAVWDGTDGPSAAGTGAEVRAWRAIGLPTRQIEVERIRTPSRTAPPGGERLVASILVADFRGFGRLDDSGIATFVESVLPLVARVLSDAGPGEVLDQNIWGDGLMAFFRDPVVAARCALGLQREVGSLDLNAIGLPGDFGMRAALHVGPVLARDDAVRERLGYFGARVTEVARIEPATPEGLVYVSETFAAVLRLRAADGLRCHYVGREPTAKGYGLLPLYLLSEVGADGSR